MKITVNFLIQKLAQEINEDPTNMKLRHDYVSLKLDESIAKEIADKYFFEENYQFS